MTTEELNALEAAYAKATPGEWHSVQAFVQNGRAFLCISPRELVFAADTDKRIQAGSAKEADADYIAAMHNAFPAMMSLCREALARREGATALQALCSRLWHEGYAVDLAYQGHYTAKIVCGLTRRVFESQGRHETEVAAVEAAVAERDKQ